MACAAPHHTLTAAERETLNDAVAIIERHTAAGVYWSVSFNRFSETFSFDIYYFDSNDTQHPRVIGETFADKVQSSIEIEADVVVNAEKHRAERVESLRKELASLTGEAA